MSGDSFKKLYLKDLKSISKIILVLFAFQVVYFLTLLDAGYFHWILPVSGIYYHGLIYRLFTQMFLDGSKLIFPLLFLYLWFREETSGTHHQLFSLPGRNYLHLRSKMFAVLTVGLLWTAGLTVHSLLLLHLRRSGVIITDTSLISRIGAFLFRFLQHSGDLMILMGIASIVAGSVQMIRRYRVVIGTIVFLLLCGAYLIVTPMFYRFIEEILNSDASGFMHRHYMLILMGIFIFTFIIFIGFAGIYLGLFLFEKYSEV